jgi:hypothetical protein
MSKNFALRLPELDALIVLSAVLPDWECKSPTLIFNMQVPEEKKTKIFSSFS